MIGVERDTAAASFRFQELSPAQDDEDYKDYKDFGPFKAQSLDAAAAAASGEFDISEHLNMDMFSPGPSDDTSSHTSATSEINPDESSEDGLFDLGPSVKTEFDQDHVVKSELQHEHGVKNKFTGFTFDHELDKELVRELNKNLEQHLARDQDDEVNQGDLGKVVEKDRKDLKINAATLTTHDYNFDAFDAGHWADRASLPYSLEVNPIPVRSRVETQIKIELKLSPPPILDLIHLNSESISKPKLQLKAQFVPSSQHLLLDTIVVCDGDKTRDVRMCKGCINRERKRALRKKISSSAEEAHWNNETARHIAVYNCKEVVSLGAVETPRSGGAPFRKLELPLRLACYCRHHGEKTGFRVYFQLRDCTGAVVARTFTGPVMITDDHKTPGPSQPTFMGFASKSAQMSPALTPIQQQSPVLHAVRTPPVCVSGPASARHTPPFGPLSMPGTITPLDYTNENPRKRRKSNSEDDYGSRAASASVPPSVPASASASTTDIQALLSRTHSRRTSVASTSTSAAGFVLDHMSPMSWASPNTPPSSVSASASEHERSYVDAALANPGLVSRPLSSSLSAQDLASLSSFPVVHRVIPSSGSIRGGIEVTLLGSGFTNRLTPKFGDNRATATYFWSSSTLVTYLPPAQVAGPVAVTFVEAAQTTSQTLQVFTYTDDSDRQLIELALQVVGLKMNGRIEDASLVARRIIKASGDSAAVSEEVLQRARSEFDGPMSRPQMEDALLRCVDLVDQFGLASSLSSDWDVCNREGQTLLHLGALLGMEDLVQALLDRGARPDLADRSGFTPLHFAALHGYEDIVGLLIRDNKDLLRRTRANQTVLELADAELARHLELTYFEPEFVGDGYESVEAASSLTRIGEYFAGLRANYQETVVGDLLAYLFSERMQNAAAPSNAPVSAPVNVEAPPSYDEIFPGGSSNEDFSRSAFDPAKEEQQAEAVASATDSASASVVSLSDEEQVVEAWKGKRRKLGNDRMLFFFWLPALIMTMTWLYFKLTCSPDIRDPPTHLTDGFRNALFVMAKTLLGITTRTGHIVTSALVSDPAQTVEPV